MEQKTKNYSRVLVTEKLLWQSTQSNIFCYFTPLQINITLSYVIRIIFDALRAGRTLYYWIGLGDNGHEGSFRWVNGRSTSTQQTALWADGQPGGGSSENCCLIYSSNLFTHDYPCSRAFRALCQKPI